MGFRTDLALESREMLLQNVKEKEKQVSGIEETEETAEGNVRINRIRIMNETGAKAIGKPMGTYITLTLPEWDDDDEEIRKAAEKALAVELSAMIPFCNTRKVLVIGLGNRHVTPDSLGPLAAEKIRVTRHLFLLTKAKEDSAVSCVSMLTPGVMATTGMESAELIKGAVEIVKPDVVLAVDALAARDVKRINRTIQITDTGISPGSGTGNMRKDLTAATLGCRVVALGIPTVIDAKTLVLDGLEGFLSDIEGAESFLEKKGESMIVSTTDIDEVIRRFSSLIAEAVNIALHPGIYS